MLNIVRSLWSIIYITIRRIQSLHTDTYLANISTPVSCIFLWIPFHDFLILNTSLAFRGRRLSVGGGADGSINAVIVFPLVASFLSSTFVCAHPIVLRG